MKKGYILYLSVFLFSVFRRAAGKCFRSFRRKKASAENPKTTDRSSEESEQTSEQTEASVSAEEHSGQTDIQNR